ncbi:MAG TPA: carboxypeptidase regulatory-like domain-containing protein [Gemmatimonadales bacterium]|nr:carboxypeptidase regulatory-like domain-containing protein [Gemmatimonadales bacterium]
MLRGIALLVGVTGLVGWQRAATQAAAPGGRVTGRIALLEKGDKPSRDLSSAVVYLEGSGAPARPVTVEIKINDKGFVPRVVAVPVGSTVRFANHDPFDHNVFSASEPNQFDLGQYGRGEGKAWTPASPGLVRVFCNIHPRMVAFVLVMASRYYAQPAADGTFTLEDVPPGAYKLHVWHERSAEAVQDVTVTPAGAPGIDVQLDARRFHWVSHKNKYGQDYPTNAGLERY